MEATKFNNGTQTAVALENCGGLTPGLITAFWLDHGPVEYDFDCRQVIGSYDPNRKTAVPTGVGFDQIISTSQPIFYTIDFQNTGTDTAFRVQLIDQFSDNLDINTFKPEGASHPCSWELRGKNLEVLFSPIALPDSNANEVASHGHFSFSISPKSNLTGGNVIFNSAKIIFDFNWPIWTNWLQHTIGQLTVSVDEAQAQNHRWQVLGNPTAMWPFSAPSRLWPEKNVLSCLMLRGACCARHLFPAKRLIFSGVCCQEDCIFSGLVLASIGCL